MLVANLRPAEEIRSIVQTATALFIKNDRGTLCLTPLSDSIVRVSYALSEEPLPRSYPYLLAQPTFTDWSVTKEEHAIILRTPKLSVFVSKATSSIRYEDASGKLLLKERDRDSRTLEIFDSYRLVVDENTVIEEVETPDGIKKMVKDAKKAFDQKLYHTRLHLDWQEGEALYGLGQNDDGTLNLRGTTQYVHQANMKIAVPFLVSSKGYGLLLLTGSPAIFNDTAAGSYLYTEADPQMDFCFIAGGTPAGAVAGYRTLTGKATLLPRWALGYLQSQERYETADEMISIAKDYRAEGIGLDCVVLDWCSWKGNLWGQKTFDTPRFPDPKKMLDTLHSMDVRFMISVWPNMHEASDNYKEFLESGELLPATNIYDALSEKGRALYWKQANEGLFAHGVDAWWCDSSEPVTPEWSHKVKPEPTTMYKEFYDLASSYLPAEQCNAYGFYHAQAISDGQRAASQKRLMNLTRNGYTGQQRFGAVLWSGDISATWKVFAEQIPAGLNLSAAGLPYWTVDAGAFFVKRGMQWFWDGDYNDGFDDMGYRELTARWFQFAALLPVYRGHGTDIRREWKYMGKPGEPFYDALLATNRLRYRLLPYLYNAMAGVYLRDEAMMRPLGFDFPEDAHALSVKDQYMLGDALLVCPVLNPMYFGVNSTPLQDVPKTRTVYLPVGCDWVDFSTNKHYSGGQTVTVDAPIDVIPIFVKVGSVVPVIEGVALSTKEAWALPRKLLVFGGADGGCSCYDDAGDGFGYEAGEYCLTEISWNEKAQALSFTDLHQGGSFSDPRNFDVEIKYSHTL